MPGSFAGDYLVAVTIAVKHQIDNRPWRCQILPTEVLSVIRVSSKVNDTPSERSVLVKIKVPCDKLACFKALDSTQTLCPDSSK